MTPSQKALRLFNEFEDKNTTEERRKDIKKALLQIVFNFKDASVFDNLVRWSFFCDVRISNLKENVEYPNVYPMVSSILDFVRQLEIDHNSNTPS